MAFDRYGWTVFDTGEAMAVVLRGGRTVVGDRPDQPSPKAEHPEVLIERDLLAAIARDVPLVGDPIPAIRLAVALVCHQIAYVGEPFALVGPPIPQIGSAVTLDCILLAQVDQSFPLVRIDPVARTARPCAVSSPRLVDRSDGVAGSRRTFGLRE